MKQMYPRNVRVVIHPSFWICLVFAVILLPFRWMVGWILAVAIHEGGHLFGILLFRIPIYSVTVKCTGTYMQTAQMLPIQEAVVAALGPIAGLIPLLFAHPFPYLAICALALFAFNSLPFDGFDGGRVLICILKVFLPAEIAGSVVKCIQGMLLFLILLLGLHMRWSVPILSVAVILTLRVFTITFPCKRWKQIVQWSK